jgi:hypothetical protein
MRRFVVTVFIFVFFFTVAANAQYYLLQTKEAVKRKLQRYGNSKDLQTVVYETDSTLRLVVDDSNYRKLQITCFFNLKNKCYKETWQADCAECFAKNIAVYLNDKMRNWKKVNEHFFISGKFWKECILTYKDNPYSFSIIKDYLPAKEHNQLYNNLN